MISTEQFVFRNYSRVTNDLFDHTDAGTVYNKVQVLNGGNNSQVGLAKSFSVVPGDTIRAEVWAKYLGTTGGSGNLTGFATALLSAFGLPAPAPGEVGTASSALDTYGSLIAGGGNTGNTSWPKGWLNVLVFDKDYNLKDVAFQQLDGAYVQTGATKMPHQLLSREVYVKEPGYVYIYVSNEGSVQQDIYFDDMKVTHTKSPVIQGEDYYLFGLTFNSYRRENTVSNRWKFQGQEHVDDLNLGWDSFKWRNHQPEIGRFFNVDPLADKYVYNSPYAFSENHVTTHIELEGLEKVYIFDQEQNPDNKRVYTGKAYVESKDKGVQGPYRFSSFPNNDSKHNTLKEGTHKFNNKAGHHGGDSKGLNIVDDEGSRENTPGIAPNGDDVTMKWVNVHSGVDPDDNGGKHNRGSEGCPTCHPSDVNDFFSNFNFENGTTGTAEGTVTVFRGTSENATNTENNLKVKIGLQDTQVLRPLFQSDATKVVQTLRIAKEEKK